MEALVRPPVGRTRKFENLVRKDSPGGGSLRSRLKAHLHLRKCFYYRGAAADQSAPGKRGISDRAGGRGELHHRLGAAEFAPTGPGYGDCRTGIEHSGNWISG